MRTRGIRAHRQNQQYAQSANHLIGIRKERMTELLLKKGDKYDLLTVVKFSHKIGVLKYWVCRCDCGNKKVIQQSELRTDRGFPKNCGCLASKRRKTMNRTHGMTLTPIYKKWGRMRMRCNNPNYTSHKYYYDIGIRYCKRWDKFENFYADMYPKFIVHVSKHGLKNTTLDRVDSSKGYSPKNCRWATKQVQTTNRRRVYLNGELVNKKHAIKK